MASNDSDKNSLPGGAEQPQGEPQSSRPEHLVSLERFAKSFEASARRWELVVYPSLFAFIVLAAYGFFLIFNLSKDMHALSLYIDPHMEKNMALMSGNIAELTKTIEKMTVQVQSMAGNLDAINVHMTSMDGYIAKMDGHMETVTQHTGVMTTQMVDISKKLNTLEPINAQMGAMNDAIRAMTANTSFMTRDMGQLGRPMNFMNKFMPW